MDTTQTTELARRENTNSLPIKSVEDLRIIGEVFARSCMFGCDTADKGMVLAMTCHMQRMTPMEFVETYHIVEGRPSMRADAMLAKLHEFGGRYQVIARTPERAAIEAEFRGAKYTSTLSWSEAQLEPFPFTGKKDEKGDKILKKNWATPRARMQMLWARVVSDAVRTVCPLANRGNYTPEEIEDIEPAKSFAPTPVPAAVTVPSTEAAKVFATSIAPPVPEAAPTPAAPTPAASSAEEVPMDAMPIGKQRGAKFAKMTDQQLARASSLTPWDGKNGVEGWTEGHRKNVLLEIESRAAAKAKPAEVVS